MSSSGVYFMPDFSLLFPVNSDLNRKDILSRESVVLSLDM